MEMMPGVVPAASTSHVVLVKPKPLRCGSVNLVRPASFEASGSSLPGLKKVIDRDNSSFSKKFGQGKTAASCSSSSTGQIMFGYPQFVPSGAFGSFVGSSGVDASGAGYVGFGFSYTSFPHIGFPVTQSPGIPVPVSTSCEKLSSSSSACQEGKLQNTIPILTTTTTTTTTLFSGIGSVLPLPSQMSPKPLSETSKFREDSQSCGGECDHGSEVISQGKKKRIYRKRVRSAEVDKLTLMGPLGGPEDEVMNCIRVWVNSKGTKFYDCKCGTRKAIHDLKKIKEHVCRHFNSKKRKGIINFC